MMLGLYPSSKLLKKYKMKQFEKLTSAARSGNVKLFNDSLLENQSIFIRQGTYLILEKARIIVYRNLFKRM